MDVVVFNVQSKAFKMSLRVHPGYTSRLYFFIKYILLRYLTLILHVLDQKIPINFGTSHQVCWAASLAPLTTTRSIAQTEGVSITRNELQDRTEWQGSQPCMHESVDQTEATFLPSEQPVRTSYSVDTHIVPSGDHRLLHAPYANPNRYARRLPILTALHYSNPALCSDLHLTTAIPT